MSPIPERLYSLHSLHCRVGCPSAILNKAIKFARVRERGYSEMRRGRMPQKHDTMSDKQQSKKPIAARDSGDNIMSREVSRREFLVCAGGISAALALGGFSSARAAEAPPVKIGFILPERGPNSADAKSLMAGFDLFFKESGLEKSPVEVVKKDPGPNDEKVVECLTELVASADVRFLVGPLSLKGSEQTIHGVRNENIILFVANPSIRLVSGEMCLPSSFRISANTYQCGQPLGPWAVRNVGTKVFITGDNDVEGNEKADFFANGFEKAGGAFVDRVMADQAGMKGVLNAISKSDATVVFAAFKGETAVAFLKEFRKFSPALKQPLIGPGSLTRFPQTIVSLKSAAAKVKTLSSVSDAAELVNNIKKKLRIEVSDAVKAAEGYDIAAIITKAIGAFPEGLSDVAKTAKAIEEMEIEGPRGKIRFDKNHEPILDMVAQEWESAGSSYKQKVLDNLGPCQTPDFGCGRIGFPKRPEAEIKDEEPFGEQSDN
jgi:branched-chain amino acid transport system substrate-binding protein